MRTGKHNRFVMHMGSLGKYRKTTQEVKTCEEELHSYSNSAWTPLSLVTMLY